MKTVGGKIITVHENTELITWETCELPFEANVIVGCFFIRNEDTKDIYVKVNEGSEFLLKPNEILDLSGLTTVNSCVVCTDNATIRWGGLM